MLGSSSFHANQRFGSGAPIASDKQLLEAISEGDKSAMRLLLTRHHMRIHRFVIAITGDPATTE